jgi:uncharacterized RDD family membrane protein YckC
MASVPNSGSGAPPPPVWDARPPEMQVRYAGFWLRTVAAIIDGIILGIITQIVGYFIVDPQSLPPPPDTEDTEALFNYIQAAVRAAAPIQQIIFSTVLFWAYFAFQESSPAQATLGKRALGIRVSTVDGARLDLAKASLRAWPIFLPNASWLLGPGIATLVTFAAIIACLTVAFSSRKQGLHDMMAGAVLTRRPYGM